MNAKQKLELMTLKELARIEMRRDGKISDYTRDKLAKALARVKIVIEE